jgi:hypothetical protein
MAQAEEGPGRRKNKGNGHEKIIPIIIIITIISIIKSRGAVSPALDGSID